MHEFQKFFLNTSGHRNGLLLLEFANRFNLIIGNVESSQRVAHTKHVFSRCFTPGNFKGVLQEELVIQLTNFGLFNR